MAPQVFKLSVIWAECIKSTPYERKFLTIQTIKDWSESRGKLNVELQ
jgi:hypothetical protein